MEFCPEPVALKLLRTWRGQNAARFSGVGTLLGWSFDFTMGVPRCSRRR
jgi:hypothetical protein